MIRKWTLILACLLGCVSASYAQVCGSTEAHRQLMQQDPAYAASHAQHKLDWAQYMATNVNSLIVNTPQGPVYEIPVVVHIMHTGGAVGSLYNPRNDSIISMINYLNAAYATTWPQYPNSVNGGTRIPVRFALAKRTPDCQPTDGILRTNVSANAAYVANGVRTNAGNPGVTDASIKALSIWPNDRYYNIWIVNKINGQDGTSGSFTAGFAYYPGAPATIDGTVMLATQSRSNRITLVHEIGHAFNLAHTFEGDDTGCPVNGNCNTDGDEVCDTEPHTTPVNFACQNTGNNPCTGAPWNFVAYNFMNYTTCQNRFTPGQRDRFMFALLNYRPELISSLGATALPTSPLPAPACVPTIAAATAGNNNNAGPREVEIADMVAVTGGYNTDGNRVYVDRTCNSMAHMNTGQTYNVNINTGGSPQRVRVWIDYNNNGLFTDANELAYAHDGTSNNETHSGTLTVPSTGVATCTPLRMRVAADRNIAPVPGPCSQYGYGQAEDYLVEIRGSGNTATVGIALTAGTNPSCTGSPLTFTATTSGSPTAPTFSWFVDGINTGVTGTTYSSAALTNGQVVTARLYYAGTCGSDSATAAGITVQRSSTVVPAVGLALTGGTNPGCPGQLLTFTATPTSGGTAPVYTWTVNGNPQAGVTGSTFSSTTLNTGDIVQVSMVSNLACANPATATSNSITITFSTLTASVSQAITAGTNPGCAGRNITFTATGTNGGTAPVYAWTVNGTPSGVTGSTFSSTQFQNGDVVQVSMLSNNPCVTNPVASAAPITLTVIPNDTPRVSIALVSGNNPGCLDSLLSFEAIGSSMGLPPVYTWFLNGTQVAIGSTYTGTTFANSDIVTVRAITGGPGCRTSDTVFSDPLLLIRSTTPAAPVISWIGGILTANQANVQWYGPNGLIPGATAQTYFPTTPGTYYAVTMNTGCGSAPSNMLLVQNVSVGTYAMDGLNIYPNPSRGRLALDWKTVQKQVRVSIYTVTGQGLFAETLYNVSRRELDLSGFANGSYFLVLQDEKGAIGTTRFNIVK